MREKKPNLKEHYSVIPFIYELGKTFPVHGDGKWMSGWLGWGWWMGINLWSRKRNFLRWGESSVPWLWWWLRAKSLQLRPTVCDTMDCSWAPLSMGFPRQEDWMGCHALLQGNLPDPGIEPESLTSSALAGGFFTTSTTWEAHSDGYMDVYICQNFELILLNINKTSMKLTWKFF